MWTRAIMIVACCLLASSVLAAPGSIPEGVEVVGTPDPFPQPVAVSMPCNTVCETPVSPTTTPWYYWWTTWHWFDRCPDHGQHYAYLPPLPGWYYFRPYSVSQLRAQQEAVMQWGGDPRNPYATGTLPKPEEISHQSAVAPIATRTSSSASYEIVAAPASPSSASMIPWPTILLDPRFAADRARIEEPYRRVFRGRGTLTAVDYHAMIDAAAQMKATLWRMTADVTDQQSLNAEKFLDQLAAEARGQLQAGLATVSSGPSSSIPEPYGANSW